MVECKVLKKYKDASLDSKTLEKGTIVEYELEKAEKLQKSGYVKIIGDVTPITSEITTKVEEPEVTVPEDKEEQELEETNANEELEEDKESDDEKEIEMATMPKKYKKKK